MLTYNTQAIILTRSDWREYDSRLLAYSPGGKLSLVARGVKKPSSKLAAHIEPLNLVDLMIVSGRQFDYVGGILAQEVFAQIKSDLDKLKLAGQAVNFFRSLIVGRQSDENIFQLLRDFFYLLNQSPGNCNQNQFLFNLFIIKLLSLVGYAPELRVCASCRQPLEPNKTWFDVRAGGLVCSAHQPAKEVIKISPNGVKLLRLGQNLALKDFKRVRLGNWADEFNQVIDLLIKNYK